MDKRRRARIKFYFERMGDEDDLPDSKFKAKYTPDFKESRVRELTGMVEPAESLRVQQMPSFSKAFTQKIRDAEGINPVVYRAILKTMRHAAFFRYVRQKHKATIWARFFASVRGLNQDVETPTAMKR